MNERYQLPLTKREARQLFGYLLQVENEQPGAKPKKEFWERHEKLAIKLQGIIYDAGTTTGNSEKPKTK